jgi:hypothetical protein
VDVIQLICLTLLVFGVGVAFLFFGYRFFLILLPIWGFFMGFWLGALTISILLGEGFLVSMTSLVVGFVAGLILAVLSYLFYSVGVLLLGVSFGYWFATFALYAIGLNPGFIAAVVGILTAIVFAVLIVILDVKKHLIIVITALGGAGCLMISVLFVFGVVTIPDLQLGAALALNVIIQNSLLWLVLWSFLGTIGIFIQEMTNRGYYLEYDQKFST